MLFPPHRWTQQRNQGKYAFVVFYGFFRAGAPIGLIVFLLAELAPELKLTPFAGEAISASILFGMLYGSILGTLVGCMAWWLNEREFKKWVPKEDEKDDRRPPPTKPSKRTRYE